jgi:HK97 family phage major capsid protein
VNVIENIREQRDAKKAVAEALINKATREHRDLNPTEDRECVLAMNDAKSLTNQLEQQIDLEARSGAAAGAAARLYGSNVQVRSEGTTYSPVGGQSYFRDLIAASMPGRGIGDGGERARLDRHNAETRTNMNRTDGTGGEFVPTLWLVDEFLPLARAARTTADLFNRVDLPAGTDTISLPSVATGTAVAMQTADAAAVQSTDMTTSSVSGAVKTIAGQQDIAMQLLDQSPIAFDRVVMGDLLADLASKLDVQVINGSNASGQVQGILTVSGLNSVTYTSGTPTVAGLYSKLADGIRAVHVNRYLPPTAMVMHPRRWMWFLAAVDTSNRPLVTPSDSVGPWNALGVGHGVAAQGPVGQLLGLPVYVDPNIPTNLGAGTNEDRIIVAKWDDLWLFEGSVRTRVLPEVLSGNLQVRIQAYEYFTVIPQRYPAAITVLSGTGLITPVF